MQIRFDGQTILVVGAARGIGRAIAEELTESDMSRGPSWMYLADGDDELYMTVRIRFARHPLEDEPAE